MGDAPAPPPIRRIDVRAADSRSTTGRRLPSLEPEPSSSGAADASSRPGAARDGRGGDDPMRQTIEFLVVLSLASWSSGRSSAEAYIVPTGSMAPTLLGQHKELTCPNCKRFVLGRRRSGPRGRRLPELRASMNWSDSAVPLASKRRPPPRPEIPSSTSAPRRWEIGRLPEPGRAEQAYVKRVVALPGERSRSSGATSTSTAGSPASRPPSSARSAILVFDNDFLPADSAGFPGGCSAADRYPGGLSRPAGWKAEGTGFVHDADQDDVPPTAPTGSTIATGTPTPTATARSATSTPLQRRPISAAITRRPSTSWSRLEVSAQPGREPVPIRINRTGAGEPPSDPCRSTASGRPEVRRNGRWS